MLLAADPIDWTWTSDSSAPVGQVPRATRYRSGYRVNYVNSLVGLLATAWALLRALR